MKKIRQIVLAILISAIISSTSLAGDYSQLNFIGFSRNGKYLAFEEYGVSFPDETGYSSIFFVNTLKNDFSAPRISLSVKDSFEKTYGYSSDSTARKRALISAAPQLKRFGIIAGNTGDQLISRLLTDVTEENTPLFEPKSVVFTPDRREAKLNGRFQLSLKTVVQNQFCRDSDDLELVEYVGAAGLPFPKITNNPNRKTDEKDKQKLFSFELSLKNDDANQTKILQKALATPLSRGCAIDYRIHSVYLYKNHIAVFVGIITPGFVGDNIRLMVVTGELEDEINP
jgi:predicted secreted protein